MKLVRLCRFIHPRCKSSVRKLDLGSWVLPLVPLGFSKPISVLDWSLMSCYVQIDQCFWVWWVRAERS